VEPARGSGQLRSGARPWSAATVSQDGRPAVGCLYHT